MGLITLDRLIEEAVPRARENGCVDLCDLAQAISLGFDADTFQSDVETLAFAPSEEY